MGCNMQELRHDGMKGKGRERRPGWAMMTVMMMVTIPDVFAVQLSSHTWLDAKSLMQVHFPW